MFNMKVPHSAGCQLYSFNILKKLKITNDHLAVYFLIKLNLMKSFNIYIYILG